jgi:hypothetical protein
MTDGDTRVVPRRGRTGNPGHRGDVPAGVSLTGPQAFEGRTGEEDDGAP